MSAANTTSTTGGGSSSVWSRRRSRRSRRTTRCWRGEFGAAITDYIADQLELVLAVFDRLHETSLRVTALLRGEQ
ncbi:hypothetical protein ACRS6B_04985 [Nocardia asteroides]